MFKNPTKYANHMFKKGSVMAHNVVKNINTEANKANKSVKSLLEKAKI